MSTFCTRVSWRRFAAMALVASIGFVRASAQPPLPAAPQEGETRPAIAAGGDQTGYLGVIADDRADPGRGVRILDALRGAAADQAGLKAGDLVVNIDGRPIRGMVDMAAALRPTKPGQRMKFVVERGGQSKTIDVVLGRRPPAGKRPFPQFGRIKRPAEASENAGSSRPRGLLGVRATQITPSVQRQLRLPTNQGALVASVVSGSPADQAGIPPEAIIVAVNGKMVADPADLARYINQAGPGSEVELRYYDRGRLVRKKVVLRPPTTSAEVRRTPIDQPDKTAIGQPESETLPAPGATNLKQLDQRMFELEQRMGRLEELLQKLINKPSPAPENTSPGEP